jgi:hypothetical protein
MIALNLRDRALTELAGALWLDQSAPLGWLATERAVMCAFGLGETAVRVVPALIGIAAIAVATWVGQRWMTTAGAVALVTLSSLGHWVFHYTLEVKSYSGDTLLGMLLPALVVWTIEADTPRQRLRRAVIWWTIAALANGGRTGRCSWHPPVPSRSGLRCGASTAGVVRPRSPSSGSHSWSRLASTTNSSCVLHSRTTSCASTGRWPCHPRRPA